MICANVITIITSSHLIKLVAHRNQRRQVLHTAPFLGFVFVMSPATVGQHTSFAALKHLITICFAGQSTEQLPIPRLTSSKPLRRGSNLPIFMDIRKSSNDRNFHRSLVVHKATYEPGLILPAVTAKVRLPTRKTDPPLALNFWTGKRSQIWCRRRVPRQLGDSPPDTKVCPDFGSQNKDPRRVARNK